MNTSQLDRLLDWIDGDEYTVPVGIVVAARLELAALRARVEDLELIVLAGVRRSNTTWRKEGAADFTGGWHDVGCNISMSGIAEGDARGLPVLTPGLRRAINPILTDEAREALRGKGHA